MRSEVRDARFRITSVLALRRACRGRVARGVALIGGLSAALLLLAPSLAAAQPMDTFGMGSRSIALGGAVTADVEDFSANYYNPAGIVRGRELRVGAGWFGAVHDLSLNGLDSGVDPVHGSVVGLNVPGNIDGFRFAFGLGVHLNDQHVSRTRTLPRERPRWEFYDNRPHRTYLATHLAIEPFDWLRIGGGIAFLSLSANTLSIRGDIDALRPDAASRLEHELNGELLTIRYPQVGVQVQPISELSFGAVYRGEFGLDNRLLAAVGDPDPTNPGAVRINVSDITIPGFFNLLSESVNAYVPHQISFGAAWQALPTLRISAELTWLMWSRYQSPIGTSEVELRIEVPPELRDMIMVPDTLVGGEPVPANFDDRLVPRLGIEWRPYQANDLAVDLRFGYFYENSPAPAQTGPYNLIDTDRHAFSAGVGLLLTDLRPVLPGFLSINAHFQYGLLPARGVEKTSPIDPTGDYIAEGHIFVGGLSIEAGFE